jgi:RNA polymerase sigma-70 factor (ECF subfamily)
MKLAPDGGADHLRCMDFGGLTDAQAVRAVLAGRTEAFAVLVRRYQDVLFAHAVRMLGARDEAADLVQKSLVRGFRKLGSCREPERVGGWLFRILANECKECLRSRRRSDLSLETLPFLPDRGAPSPEGDAHAEELRERVRAALGALDPDQREAFVMKHVEGRSYEEISALLGVSIPALKMRVHRAREGLQEQLEVYR